MPVQVEDLRLQHQAGQPGFLLRLAQRHPPKVTVAVGMAARLQPQAQLAVVGEQGAPAVGADQQRRCGQVAGQALAHVRVARSFDQLDEVRHAAMFGGPPRQVVVKRGGKGVMGADGVLHALARLRAIGGDHYRRGSSAGRRLWSGMPFGKVLRSTARGMGMDIGLGRTGFGERAHRT